MTTVPPQRREHPPLPDLAEADYGPKVAPSVFGTRIPREQPRQEWVTGEQRQARRQLAVSVRSVVMVLGVLFFGLAMMVLGVAAGKSAQTTHTPDQGTLSVLRYAQQHSDAPCYAVWGQNDSQWSVKCGTLK